MAGARQPMVNLLQIDFDEIEDREIVGRGSYGTVYKAEWQNRYVAVKEFYVNAEQKAIESEIKQLSRVVHPNIIALYGVSAKNGCIYLVMEFAEGGTLHNFLHGNSEPYYSAAHAMSWARQCAEGAAYLHAMQPKPLIHRDLKPLNLLLVNHGRNLKICDFGTVADKATLMTNNKGSAAWMAPEVFEGHKYTEKCDVFSWGIILWEMLSRQQPFKEYKEALPIMWGVHKGDRPPLIEGCPKPIEDLYTSCWSHSPAIRPSMKHIVEIMTKLCEFFPGADQPLDYKSTTDPPQASTDLSETDTTIGNKSFSLSSLNSSQKAPTNTDSVRNLANMFNNLSQANSATSGGKRTPRLSSNASSSTLNSDPIPEDKEVKFKAPDEYISPHFNDPYRLKPSAETTKRAEIIRNGILKGSPKSPISVNIDENAWELGAQPKSVGNDLSKSDGKERLVVKETKSVIPEDDDESPNASPVDYEYSDHQSLHEMLDPSLQPEPPIPNNRLSQELYQEHIRLAKEYLRVDTQLYYAKDDRDKYLATLDPVEREQKEAFLRKHSEKEELLELYKNLKQQLESKRAAQQNHNTSDPQTSRSAKLPSQMSSEGLATEVVDDGWLVIAPKESNT